MSDAPLLDAELETRVARQLFNQVWELLDRPGRTAEDDDRMVHMAHASRHHWERTGTAQNLAIGEWQVARVYSELGLGEAALRHATRCWELTQNHPMDDFVAPSAAEGMARALFVCGRTDEGRQWRACAIEGIATIADPGDAAIIRADVDQLDS